MGQYHKVVNLSRRESLEPNRCGDLKNIINIAYGEGQTMFALTLLLAGPWKGERVAIVGDYYMDSRRTKLHDKALKEAGIGRWIDPYDQEDMLWTDATETANATCVKSGCAIDAQRSWFYRGKKQSPWKVKPIDDLLVDDVKHIVVNLDRKELVDPEQLGDHPNVRVFSSTGAYGVTTGLAALLAISNDSSGGDLDDAERTGVIGAWAGDRIAVLKDTPKRRREFENISDLVRVCVRADSEHRPYWSSPEWVQVGIGKWERQRLNDKTQAFEWPRGKEPVSIDDLYLAGGLDVPDFGQSIDMQAGG